MSIARKIQYTHTNSDISNEFEADMETMFDALIVCAVFSDNYADVTLEDGSILRNESGSWYAVN